MYGGAMPMMPSMSIASYSSTVVSTPKCRYSLPVTSGVAHMSVAKWRESAASASDRCWRAIRPSVRERLKAAKNGQLSYSAMAREAGVGESTLNAFINGKYTGNEIKLDGTEYIIMREDDVLGVLDAAPQALLKAR